MPFNSLTFVIFCFATFGLYYVPILRRVQVLILIVASFIFYGWTTPKLLLLLLFSIALNSVVSFFVATSQGRRQIIWATLGVIANVSLLAFFKYAALLTDLVLQGTGAYGDLSFLLLHIPLPIGISFYTFEGISLLMDVLHGPASGATRGSVVAPRFRDHLQRTALFVAFYPHLIAGPILKARHFYPQIALKRFRDIPWSAALHNLLLGYFLKVVVADNLKDYTYRITYPYFQAQSTTTLVFVLLGFSMQIFADFAGYSLIAIGVAALFGYELPANFNFPYVSRSIAEFWKRWHISLSTWLRDYLYFPLGGNRKGQLRTYLNLLIVMLLGGLWHGASWTFAVWGLYHGFGLAIERWIMDRQGFQSKSTAQPGWGADLIRIGFVFTFATMGWLLFKLHDLQEMSLFLQTLRNNAHLGPAPMVIWPIIIYSLPVVIYHARHLPLWEGKLSSNSFLGLAYAVMLLLICLNYGTSNAFIYFQF